jgi:sulfate transporter 4
MFQSYPVTGSFSRSAVNNETGAKSGISAIVTATLVMLTLLFLTVLFEKLPLAVLAAIVISGVLGLLDYPEAIHLFHVHKFDFAVWCISCFGTMFLGVEVGLTIAVVVSILLVIYESAYPHTAVLGRLPGTTVYRNVKQYTEAERYHGILMCRIDAPIYFANTQHVRDKINKYERMAEETPKYVIVDLSPVSHVDTSAMHILEDMRRNYDSRGIQLCLCNPNKIVMNYLRLSGLEESIGQGYIFVRMHDAVLNCLEEMEASEVSVDVEKQTTGAASSSASNDASVEMMDTSTKGEVNGTEGINSLT